MTVQVFPRGIRKSIGSEFAKEEFSTLSIGDAVVYRNRVCIVRNIHESYLDDRDYYELEAVFGKSLKLYVPVENAVEPTCRAVMSKSDALALIDSVASIDEGAAESSASGVITPALLDRRVEEDYLQRIRTYSPDQLLRVMKSAHRRSLEREGNGKSMTATDRKYQQIVESLLFDELSLSLGIDREDVPRFFARRIEGCSN